jgi:hypothetical protein
MPADIFSRPANHFTVLVALRQACLAHVQAVTDFDPAFLGMSQLWS